MLYLIKDNQISGMIENPDEAPGGYAVVEGADGNIFELYYDPTDEQVKPKPEQPENSIWDGNRNCWKTASTIFDPVEPSIDDVKNARISEFSQRCRKRLLSGFDSSALGSAHHYDSEETDQMNLLGAVLTESTVYYVCTDLKTGLKTPIEHTAEQMRIVLMDGAKIKQDCLSKYHELANRIKSAQTIEAVNAVTYL
jgi:hypothetical protein